MLAPRFGGAVLLGAAVLLAACHSGSEPSCSGASCIPPGTLSLNLGEVRPQLPGSSISVSGGPNGGEFALVPFNASTTPSLTVSLSVTGTGIGTVSSAATSRMTTGPSLNVVPSPADPSTSFANRFEYNLRQRERRELTPLIPSAREWYRGRSRGNLSAGSTRSAPLGASFTQIPSSVTVGEIIPINSNANRGCDSAQYRNARVVAITQKAIVLADTSNPVGGFTDAQYQSIGVTFDTLVDPLDETNFGAPSDIDNNGHVILYFTRAVNELTPANSPSFVGGFFFGRDLFPQTATPTIQACPASNVGELFYLLVPDPLGLVNGNKRSTGFVDTLTTATVAHEFQHLINAARRLYVNTAATDFETVWLNEGLSHSAEELLFYRASGLTPQQNIDVNTLRSKALYVTDFNSYAIGNFGRYHQYLKAPSTNSPYNANDSLATRGATWSMLRYLADHHTATPEAMLWFSLVNSTTTGIQNLMNVYGADVVTNQIRDWATSVFTDDLSAGVAAQWQQPSWNFRSIYPALQITPFPLPTIQLQSGSAVPVSLIGGGVAFLRFEVDPNQTGTISFTTSGGGAPPPNMQFTVVRTK